MLIRWPPATALSGIVVSARTFNTTIDGKVRSEQAVPKLRQTSIILSGVRDQPVALGRPRRPDPIPGCDGRAHPLAQAFGQEGAEGLACDDLHVHVEGLTAIDELMLGDRV